jgi:hypothetical protein
VVLLLVACTSTFGTNGMSLPEAMTVDNTRARWLAWRAAV